MTDTQREKKRIDAGGKLPEEAGKCSQGIKRKTKSEMGTEEETSAHMDRL